MNSTIWACVVVALGLVACAGPTATEKHGSSTSNIDVDGVDDSPGGDVVSGGPIEIPVGQEEQVDLTTPVSQEEPVNYTSSGDPNADQPTDVADMGARRFCYAICDAQHAWGPDLVGCRAKCDRDHS